MAPGDHEIKSEDQQVEAIASQEDVIKANCKHLIEFVEEITKCDPKQLSKGTLAQVKATKAKIFQFFEADLGDGDDHHNRDDRGGSSSDKDSASGDGDGENPSSKRKKLFSKSSKQKSPDVSSEQKSIIEILVDKLDYRRAPHLENFDESGSGSLESYLDKFETYCQDEIRTRSGDDDKVAYIVELKKKLTGDALKGFNAIRDDDDSYNTLKYKLLVWYGDMKDMRKKKAKRQFEKAGYNLKEGLYVYSLRLEKLFKQAYPSSSIEKSSTLREQYLNTIPSNIKSKLKEHLFNNKLNGKSTTWSEIQRYARFRDVMLEEQECEKSNSDSDKDTEVIEINTGRAIRKKIPDTDMQVEYDKGNKKFFYS